MYNIYWAFLLLFSPSSFLSFFSLLWAFFLVYFSAQDINKNQDVYDKQKKCPTKQTKAYLSVKSKPASVCRKNSEKSTKVQEIALFLYSIMLGTNAYLCVSCQI